MKASVFRRWPVTAPYRGEQTTRLTGGHDYTKGFINLQEGDGKMERNDEIKMGNFKEYLIGILLLVPLYIPILSVLGMMVEDYNGEIVVPIAMYLPAVIGLVILYVSEKDEVNTMLTIGATVSLVIALCCWYMTYANDTEGWGGLGYVFGWLICSVVFRVLVAIYLGRTVGKKKTIIFCSVYLLAIIISFLFRFWA